MVAVVRGKKEVVTGEKEGEVGERVDVAVAKKGVVGEVVADVDVDVAVDTEVWLLGERGVWEEEVEVPEEMI